MLGSPVDPPRQITPRQHQVFRDTQARRDGEVLIDHADLQLMRIAWGANRTLAVVDQNTARLQRAVANDAFDQRAFTRAVFAEQGVDGAGAHLERHFIQRAKRTEMFADTNGFQARGAHVHAFSRSRSSEE